MEKWIINIEGTNQKILLICDTPADFELVRLNEEISAVLLTIHTICPLDCEK